VRFVSKGLLMAQTAFPGHLGLLSIESGIELDA